MVLRHKEQHRTERIGWLRAAVLGANDGIVSTASLVVGVAAADPSRGSIMVAGVAGLVAGAMSMAAGVYVSVSSVCPPMPVVLRSGKPSLASLFGEHSRWRRLRESGHCSESPRKRIRLYSAPPNQCTEGSNPHTCGHRCVEAEFLRDSEWSNLSSLD